MKTTFPICYYRISYSLHLTALFQLNAWESKLPLFYFSRYICAEDLPFLDRWFEASLSPFPFTTYIRRQSLKRKERCARLGNMYHLSGGNNTMRLNLSRSWSTGQILINYRIILGKGFGFEKIIKWGAVFLLLW